MPNEYGLDADYFIRLCAREFNPEVIRNQNPQDLARAFARAAHTACAEVLQEREFQASAPQKGAPDGLDQARRHLSNAIEDVEDGKAAAALPALREVAHLLAQTTASTIRAEQAKIADYEESMAGHRRLVRELDMLLNGKDGAAPQASLCDLVAQVASTGAPLFSAQPRGLDTQRLDFMLNNWRKVVCERLPHDNFEVYVEEGCMGDKRYPGVRYSGEWERGSPEAMEIQREAIDAALLSRQRGGKA